MASTYINYDPTTAVGAEIKELAALLSKATQLAATIKIAILAMDDSPTASATNIEAALVMDAGTGNDMYSAISSTDEDLTGCNVWQKFYRGETL